MRPAAEPVLAIQGLTQVYADGTRALDRVDLSAPFGILGLLGPNGAGKSTLMRSLAGLQTPTGGSIRLGDIDVIAEPERLRRTLGYLPQDFGVYPGLSARDLLDHLAVLKGFPRRRERRDMVEALLRQVQLWSVRDRALASLSGGMRRRFGIAQALIGDPRLLILDEPTAGLDPEERNRLLDLLAETGERAVVILSTHIVEDVSDLCPRVAVLVGGRIRLDGAPDDLVVALRDRLWRKSVNRAGLASEAARHAVISSRLAAGRIVVRVLADARPDPGYEPAEAGLEDAYFAVMRASRDG